MAAQKISLARTEDESSEYPPPKLRVKVGVTGSMLVTALAREWITGKNNILRLLRSSIPCETSRIVPFVRYLPKLSMLLLLNPHCACYRRPRIIPYYRQVLQLDSYNCAARES